MARNAGPRPPRARVVERNPDRAGAIRVVERVAIALAKAKNETAQRGYVRLLRGALDLVDESPATRVFRVR